MTDEPTPKMPKGVAMMLKSVLGIDPAQLMGQFTEAFNVIKGFCQHADQRIGVLAKQVENLTGEIKTMREQLSLLKEDHHDGYTGQRTVNGRDAVDPHDGT